MIRKAVIVVLTLLSLAVVADWARSFARRSVIGRQWPLPTLRVHFGKARYLYTSSRSGSLSLGYLRIKRHATWAGWSPAVFDMITMVPDRWQERPIAGVLNLWDTFAFRREDGIPASHVYQRAIILPHWTAFALTSAWPLAMFIRGRLLIPLGLMSGLASGWCFLRFMNTGYLFVPGVLFGIVVLGPFLRFAARPLRDGVVLVAISTVAYGGARSVAELSLAAPTAWAPWTWALCYGLAGLFGSFAVGLGVQHVVRLSSRLHVRSLAKLVTVGTIGGVVFWAMVDSGPQIDVVLPAAFTVWQGATAAALMPYLNAARRRRRDQEAGHFCKKCAYDLTGNTSGICPECGTKIESP